MKSVAVRDGAPEQAGARVYLCTKPMAAASEELASALEKPKLAVWSSDIGGFRHHR